MYDFIVIIIISIAIVVASILLYLNFTPSFITQVTPTVGVTLLPTPQRPVTLSPTQKPVIRPTPNLTRPTAPQRPIVQPTPQRPIVQQPQPTPQQPTTNTSGSNPFVNAINAAFSLKLGSNSAQDSCTARHASAEPTLAQAHTVWRTGDTCGGGRGAVWAGSPDPTVAARLWLNSPPHASIIRSASRLACGAGPSSAVCIAY
jgi:hypothetical protein